MSDDDDGFFSPLDMHAVDHDDRPMLGALEICGAFVLAFGATCLLAWCLI